MRTWGRYASECYVNVNVNAYVNVNVNGSCGNVLYMGTGRYCIVLGLSYVL